MENGNSFKSSTPDGKVIRLGGGLICDVQGAGPRADLVPGLLMPIIEQESEGLQMAAELSDRYEEIDLLYTIAEVLGRTISMRKAAETIVREVASVVGADRASILVHDESSGMLVPIAAWGVDIGYFKPIPVDSETSIAARVFRDRTVMSYDPTDPNDAPPNALRVQSYRGLAFLSVPILYHTSQGTMKPVGVINLTDRFGSDAFSSGHRQLVAAIANQIGAAIENARLVEREKRQQQLAHELELARDLQQKLLPREPIKGGGAIVGARCRPAVEVGGDLYKVFRASEDCLGVMFGDVSSHGFPAALVMALTLSAAGIHSQVSNSPEVILERLHDSIREELARTEMYLAAMYALVNLKTGRVIWANAGHPHAFLITPDASHRLEALCPPLGLGECEMPSSREIDAVPGRDILAFFSDGLAEELGSATSSGEQRILELVWKHRDRPASEIVDTVFSDAPQGADDQTLVVVRL